MSGQQDKVARVFDAVVELETPAERAAYLDAACGQDQQFRAEAGLSANSSSFRRFHMWIASLHQHDVGASPSPRERTSGAGPPQNGGQATLFILLRRWWREAEPIGAQHRLQSH